MNRYKFTSKIKIKCGQKWQNKAILTQYAIILSEPDPTWQLKDHEFNKEYEIEVHDMGKLEPDRMWISEYYLRKICYLKA